MSYFFAFIFVFWFSLPYVVLSKAIMSKLIRNTIVYKISNYIGLRARQIKKGAISNQMLLILKC